MTAATQTTNDLHVEVWGDGTPVVLIHGALATGADEWEAQRPLAQHGFQLVVPDRRGYGSSPAAVGEDYLVDAIDVIALMGDGAHLVGHSYGGLAALYAAVLNPERTLSLTLLEPPVTSIVVDHPSVRALDAAVREVWASDVSDEEWVQEMLTAVGSDPDQLPAELLAAAAELAPVCRAGRPYFDAAPPLEVIAPAPFPKLVVSGGYDAGWEAICAQLAARIGGEHTVIEGAGHEIQFTGQPLNDRLLALWR